LSIAYYVLEYARETTSISEGVTRDFSRCTIKSDSSREIEIKLLHRSCRASSGLIRRLRLLAIHQHLLDEFGVRTMTTIVSPCKGAPRGASRIPPGIREIRTSAPHNPLLINEERCSPYLPRSDVTTESRCYGRLTRSEAKHEAIDLVRLSHFVPRIRDDRIR
jgi:hypothetical protein